MTLTADLRRPGIYFLPAPTQPATELPPLDVAAFVGYAARGPLDHPVPVGDAATYAAIFGGDLALARQEAGGTIWANLPTAVNLFFANGGRRCYVVRVTGENPTRTRFHLPGMVALSGTDVDASARLARVHAAWPGRWSEQVKLATRLRWFPLDATTFTAARLGELAWQAREATDSLQPGDLLQVSLGDRTWLVPIATMTLREGRLILSLPQAWELIGDPIGSPPPLFTAVTRLSLDEQENLDVAVAMINSPTETEQPITLDLVGDDVVLLEPGDVLRLQGDEGDWLAPITDLTPVLPQESPPQSSVQAQIPHFLALSAESLPALAPDRVIRLRFDLLAHENGRYNQSVDNLAFNQSHPRFWGELAYLGTSPLQQISSTPDDGQRASQAAYFYRALRSVQRLADEDKLSVDPAQFAALLAPLNQAEAMPTFLPLGMLSIISAGDYQGADPGDVGDDDLDTFDENHFFDQALISTTGRSSPEVLHSSAFDRLYIQNQRLRGLHSLFFLEEVALISLPDAGHRAWATAPTPEPAIVHPSQPDPYTGDAFLICLTAPQVDHIQPAQGSTLGGTYVTITGQRFTSSEQTAVFFNGVPAGDVVVLDETTLTCTAPPAVATGQAVVTVSNWFGAGSNDDIFTYVPPPLAHLPLLDSPDVYDEGPLRQAQRHLLTFCQARRDVVAILSLPAHYLPQDCLAWQTNLRHDFGLPFWGYSHGDTHNLADLSYAVVYHPWLMVADEAGLTSGLRAIPPDGVACGQIAWRERQRQVWVAPANQPLQAVLGTQQVFSNDDQLDLFQHNFNLIIRDYGAFRFLAAHTQSDGRDWQQLSVRRLMILLRKIAVQRGMDYVFESNDERFRAGIQFALEELLLGMFEHGAFAGRSPRQAFRVTTGPDVNPRQSVEQGRFVAQIQVAPSQPLEFITILLLRQGDGNLQTIEGA